LVDDERVILIGHSNLKHMPPQCPLKGQYRIGNEVITSVVEPILHRHPHNEETSEWTIEQQWFNLHPCTAERSAKCTGSISAPLKKNTNKPEENGSVSPPPHADAAVGEEIF
jgi:hypothetical protein